jgi:two-component system sensor histidine kinase UhpB
MRSARMKRSDDSLIGQLTAANVLLVTLTLFGASVAAGFDLSVKAQRLQFLILALAIILTLCVNLWMLQRRFAPLQNLIDRIEHIDPSEPATFEVPADEVAEIDRLSKSFQALLERVEEERVRSGKLVLRAQEEERRRVARDLHDEVNQALTAILLRLEALAQDTPPERVDDVREIKRLTNQAMDELLALARQLRPTILDDQGLVPALEAQARGFEENTGIPTKLTLTGDPATLDDDTQTAVYRVAQEALSNAGRHGRAHAVELLLTTAGPAVQLQVRDDGRGFDPITARREGLGLDGMAERARLVGGELDLRSSPGSGTEITLRVP